uniref:DUF4158 domain-containing protein n=1 Tax=Escherichia coli TaxID=562 RepID=UPI002027D1A8
VPAYGPQNDVTLKMPAFEWVHVQLHQQKGMISLSPPTICNSAAKQVQAEPASWAKYGERDVTRREHARELRTYLQLAPFGLSDFRALVRELTELAQQTDKGLLLAGQALE